MNLDDIKELDKKYKKVMKSCHPRESQENCNELCKTIAKIFLQPFWDDKEQLFEENN